MNVQGGREGETSLDSMSRMRSNADGALTPALLSKCPTCGAEFTARRRWQRFCSRRCRWTAWEAAHPRTTLPAPKRDEAGH